MMTTTPESTPAPQAMAAKLVHLCGGGSADGSAEMRNLLGGKGAGLAEMTNIGIPVPPGFTIGTEMCEVYNRSGKKLPQWLKDQVLTYLGKVEKVMGIKFGDKVNPLLMSVRSGARASMPGMMDTILNLGLNPATVEVLAKKTKSQ